MSRQQPASVSEHVPAGALLDYGPKMFIMDVLIPSMTQ